MRSFFCSLVTPEECQKIVSSLKNSAHDLDSIPVSLFKRIFPCISVPFTNLINKSFNLGIFPECLKITTITPVFKSGDSQNVDNYRPISVFSFFAKIFESCMSKRIISYILKYKIICPQQFGFLKGKSTSDAVNSILEFIYNSLNKKEYSISIFLDLKKAFDTVNRQILIKKLEYYGFRGMNLEWFKSYLKNRVQRVKIGRHVSDPLFVNIGLPQGSNMAPILFILYINDIVNASDKFLYSMYADDTALILKDSCLENLISVVNQQLSLVNNWLIANKLTLNCQKTKWILFTNAKGYVVTDDAVKINNNTIERCFQIKYLGLILDCDLKFDKHITSVCNKISKNIGVFYKLRPYVSTKTLVCLYYSFVYPFIIYCILS